MQNFQILKSLFEKNSQFWLEQLVRLGIVEKVEQLATAKIDNINPETIVSPPSKSQNSINSNGPVDIFAQEPMDVSPSPSATSSIIQRSTSSTPISGVLSESKNSQQSATDHTYGDRIRMLNVPVQVFFIVDCSGDL